MTGPAPAAAAVGQRALDAVASVGERAAVDAGAATPRGPREAGALDPAALATQSWRDVGLLEWLRALLPELAVEAVRLVTQLGDAWLLFVALAAFYWFGPDRRRGALAVALAIGALALVVALKQVFALPRPPEEAWVGHAEGYGFPSGHAVGATVAWGALALLSDRWTRGRRLAVAAAVVAVVSLSRVVLGVHYTGDVLIGVAVGGAYLAGVLAVARGNPTRAFAVAVAVGVGAILVGAGTDAVAAAGGALGGVLAWAGLDTEGRTVPATVALAALVALGGLWAVLLLLEPPWPLVLAGNALAVGGILATPAIASRYRDATGGLST